MTDTATAFILADKDASPEFKEMVSAANDVLAAYFATAEKHELCKACFAQFMIRIFTDITKVAPHTDDVGKGNVDQVGNA